MNVTINFYFGADDQNKQTMNQKWERLSDQDVNKFINNGFFTTQKKDNKNENKNDQNDNTKSILS